MFDIAVENIKCGGCANTIRNKILEENSVSSVDVDVEAGRVRIEADEQERDAIAAKLAHLGYPEVGSVAGMRSAAAKAKSFVSCAVGRMDKQKD